MSRFNGFQNRDLSSLSKSLASELIDTSGLNWYYFRMFKDLINGLIDLVYPPQCAVCQKPLVPGEDPLEDHASFFTLNPGLCPECLSKIEMNKPPFCPRCSRHLPDSSLALCKACRKHPPQYDFAWCACLYTPFTKPLLYQLKYNQRTSYRHLFSRLMIAFLDQYNLDVTQFDVILPLPLHPARKRERGYNQSELLAREISAHYGIPWRTNNLIKIRHTAPQAFLNEKERWTNIKGTFKIRNSREFCEKNVLLLDDLLTTGATTSEAASVLKSARANRVGVLTFAGTL